LPDAFRAVEGGSLQELLAKPFETLTSTTSAPFTLALRRRDGARYGGRPVLITGEIGVAAVVPAYRQHPAQSGRARLHDWRSGGVRRCTAPGIRHHRDVVDWDLGPGRSMQSVPNRDPGPGRRPALAP